jgi:hypothetical protein
MQPFFNSNDSRTRVIVSGHIWIYVVIALLLYLFVTVLYGTSKLRRDETLADTIFRMRYNTSHPGRRFKSDIGIVKVQNFTRWIGKRRSGLRPRPEECIESRFLPSVVPPSEDVNSPRFPWSTDNISTGNFSGEIYEYHRSRPGARMMMYM